MDPNSQISMKDFQVMRQLGSGSFGKVVLVKKKETEALYALKTVSLTRLSQKQKQSALNEVRLLASINIPTVVKYEGSFYNIEAQQLCVLMEYADGGDLQNLIVNKIDEEKGEGFEQNFIWKVAYDIFQGLKILHKNKIIHRDIKSANIFFSKGIAKLGDLNVSKFTQNGYCETQTGTPYYTSPDIWKGEQYGNKCDIWSTGVLIYELCCLKHPFKAADFPGLYRKVLKGEYSEIPGKYSDKMKKLVRMCLTVEQEMRPSAAQLLESSMFRQVQKEFSKTQDGQVNMLDTIKCPKVLRFLNSRLPKKRQESINKKKFRTVNFSKKEIQLEEDKPKQNRLIKKVRSEKCIKWTEEQSLNAPRITSKNSIKLPPVQKDHPSEKKITSNHGLSFSTKKLKLKPSSSKLLPQHNIEARRLPH